MRDRSGRVVFRASEIAWSTCFATDLAKIYSDGLRERGHRPPSGATIDELSRVLQDWRRRRLEDLVGRRLRVYRSREFDDQGRSAAVAAITGRACTGEPLWPYTSTKTRKLRYNDYLLNDWGIIHLHLGDTFRNDGYAARSGPLLYARVTLDDLYLLNVAGHDSCFQDRELLNIAIRNWPETFEPFRLVGVSIQGTPESPRAVAAGEMANFTRTVMMHPTRAVSSKRTKQLRSQGLNATFECETGAHYYPPGGGYSCAGTGMLSRIHADHEIWFAGQLADTIAAEIVQVATKLAECTSRDDIREMRFHLRSLDEMKRAVVLEESTDRLVQLPNVFDPSIDPVAFMKVMAAAAIS
jgi:hypothetical protein